MTHPWLIKCQKCEFVYNTGTSFLLIHLGYVLSLKSFQSCKDVLNKKKYLVWASLHRHVHSSSQLSFVCDAWTIQSPLTFFILQSIEPYLSQSHQYVGHRLYNFVINMFVFSLNSYIKVPPQCQKLAKCSQRLFVISKDKINIFPAYCISISLHFDFGSYFQPQDNKFGVN